MQDIVLAWPDKALSSNARVHWARLAEKKRAARSVAGWIAKGAGWRTLPPQTLPVTITFHPPDLRRRDRHNCQAAMKAAIDGIADAVGIDDFHWRIEWAWGDVVKGGRVVVTLRPVAVNVPFRGTIS